MGLEWTIIGGWRETRGLNVDFIMITVRLKLNSIDWVRLRAVEWMPKRMSVGLTEEETDEHKKFPSTYKARVFVGTTFGFIGFITGASSSIMFEKIDEKQFFRHNFSLSSRFVTESLDSPQFENDID